MKGVQKDFNLVTQCDTGVGWLVQDFVTVVMQQDSTKTYSD